MIKERLYCGECFEELQVYPGGWRKENAPPILYCKFCDEYLDRNTALNQDELDLKERIRQEL